MPLERVRYSSYGVPTLYVPSDVNADGQSDFFDYLDFIAYWNDNDGAVSGDTETILTPEVFDHLADINQDGLIDFFDYLEFVNQMDAVETMPTGLEPIRKPVSAGSSCSPGEGSPERAWRTFRSGCTAGGSSGTS